MKGKFTACLFVALMLLLSFGCAQQTVSYSSEPAALPPPPPQAVDTSHPRAKLVTGSERLLGMVLIENPRFRELGQLTQAEVTVRNTTENTYNLEYKYEWTDDQGFTVGSSSMWHRFTLTPHQEKNFPSTGKTPAAKNIIFTVRLPNTAFN